MDFYKLFYLFTMGDKLSNLWCAFVWISSILCFIFTMYLLFESEGRDRVGFRIFLGLWLWCFVSWILYIGTPTKKEAVIIVAGGYVGNFIQSDSNARQLPADITRFLRSQIQQAAKDNDLGSLLGPTKEETLKDSLSKLSKEQLVDQLLKH